MTGLSHSTALARAYDAVLDAEFDAMPAHLGRTCVEAPAWCEVMSAVAIWWRIALDPRTRTHDPAFQRSVERAIAAALGWTTREPNRAESWFALGAAYGARAQWRVLRSERLAAARDGKRIKEALEQALALDPQLHDAKFGLGMYRYYAAVAPAALRMLRWLLLLPGGDRTSGLQQMIDARERGVVVRGEATYQLHLIYLWYENRFGDALLLVHDLQARYPRNPLFVLIEAEIRQVYFHDRKTSETLLRSLIARAERGEFNEPALAIRRARALLTTLKSR